MMIIVFFFPVILIFCGKAVCGRNEILVISDTHLGDAQHTDSVTNLAVKDFLETLKDPQTNVSTLILNGDVVDLWTIPFSDTPPFPNEILTQKYNNVDMKEITDLLIEIIENDVHVIYINGNHDDFMSYDYLQKAGLGEIEFHPWKYEGSNFEVHHGYEWTMNNMLRPSPPESKDVMKAWSYYVVRAKITHFYENKELYENNEIGGNGIGDLIQEICEKLLENKFDLKFLSDNAWWYECDIDRQIGGKDPVALTQYTKYKTKTIFGGDWNSYNSKDTTLEQAVSKYKDDVKLWIDSQGEEYVKNMLSADPCLDYNYWIEKSSKPIFLMGHTHITEFKKIKNNTMLYVNSGCWLTNQDYFPVIRMTESSEDDGNINLVELCGFDTNKKILDVKFSSEIPF